MANVDGDKRTLLSHQANQPPGRPVSAGDHETPPPGPVLPVPPLDALVGTTLQGRYAIEKKLGEGGMGSVYLARHVTLDKLVALKVMHGEFSRKRDLVERFLQEA